MPGPILTLIEALPAPSDAFDATMADGAVIRVRRHGAAHGPRLVMSHGNGMAMDAYFPFWGPLRDRYDIILFDIRNHGCNPCHGTENHDWATFPRDMEVVRQGIDRHFGAKTTIGAFHSISAQASVLHTLAMGRRWDALVLFDPPFFPRDGHPLQPVQRRHQAQIAARAARRPERYADYLDFAAQLKGSGYFKRWVPGAHELYAHATLRRDPAGGDWSLPHPRAVESRIFGDNTDATLWPRLKNFPRPLILICSDPAFPGNPPAPAICRSLADEFAFEYVSIPDTDHFLQFEEPAEAARLMEDFLDRHGLGPNRR